MSADSGLSICCPGCGASSDSVPALLAGRELRCSSCGLYFVAAGDTAGDGCAPTVAEAEPGPGRGAAPTVAEAATEEPSLRKSSGTEWRPGDVVLGLYYVTGVLGEGGMGRVYRVRHRGWDLDLAVKVPLPSMLEASGGADLFEREAETWVNLGLHPHVVTCHYVRRWDGLPLVFAEYVDGGSLHEAIRANRFDSLQGLLDVAIQFAWGLHHAHEQGVVHRDVKPANVMLTADGLAKVTDFGLARARTVRLMATAGGQTMTVEGGGGATPAYVSPEQARGEALSRRSDVWGFALSVLELFLGARTWQFGLEAPQVLARFAADGLQAGSRPKMPEPLAELLARCFHERPEERPHDLAEVAGALRRQWETAAATSYPRREPKGGRGSADAMNNRAVSLLDLGQRAEAATLWRRALQLEPQHVEATFNSSLTAWCEARMSDPELLHKMEDASRARPTSSRARYLLGRLQQTIGLPPEAAGSFEREPGSGAGDLEADSAGLAPSAVRERSLRGLAGAVAAIAILEGDVVVAGSGSELRAWNGASGVPLRTLRLPEGPLSSLLAMPDGRLLVAAEGAPLTVWDIASGRAIKSFARQPGYATALAMLGSGLVVAGGSDRVVRIFDPASGACLRELSGHEDAVTAVAAGATFLASAGRDRTVRVWSASDGACLATLRSHSGCALAIALAETASRLVAAGEDGVVYDWSLRSGALVRSYESHGRAVRAVVLPADGARILSGGSDCTLRGFDAGLQRLSLLARFDSAVSAIATAADGTIWVGHGGAISATRWATVETPPLVLCRPASAVDEEARASSFESRLAEARRSLDAGDVAAAYRHARAARAIPGRERAEAAIALWDEVCARLPRRSLLSTWEQGRLEGHDQQVVGVALDAVNGRAATASVDGAVRCWRIGAARPDLLLRGHEGTVTGVAFVPGATTIASSGRDGTVRLWDAVTGSALAVLEGHTDVVAALDVAAGAARVASASWDGTVRLWNLRTRTAESVLEGHRANVVAVRFSTDGQLLASAGWDGNARLWDASSGAPLTVLSGHGGNVTAVALHPGGRLVATGCEDRVVRLFDPRSRRAPRLLVGHEGEVTGLAFTPEGRFLLSSSRDKTVRVWDLRMDKAVRTLPHPAVVFALALAPTGSLLATAGADRAAQLWHLDWEPEPSAAEVVGTTVAPVAAATTADPAVVRRSPGESMIARSSALRDDLRRAAPRPKISLSPRASDLFRRIGWRWIALGALVFLATAVSLLAWRKPAPRLRLSPQMASSLEKATDVVDLGFAGDCSPDEYERHLESLRSGNPSSHDLACVAARPSALAVREVLEAPLSAPEPLATLRLRRNAASTLAAMGSEAIGPVCERLFEGREAAREVAVSVLAVTSGAEADTCVREALTTGDAGARTAAAHAFGQRVARGFIPVTEAWAFVERLLKDPDRDARLTGLSLVPLFTAAFAEPAARGLAADPDPEVAAAARRTAETVAALRRTDRLFGDIEP